MNALAVFRTRIPTPATRTSSGRQPAARIGGLTAATEELVTTAPAASAAAKFSLGCTAPSRILGTRARRTLWARLEPALVTAGLAAARTPAPSPPPAAAPAAPAAAAAAASAARLPSAISRVELTIDSLRNYELIRPIPVIVESLGERNYVAEMPDLNITTTASNPSDILITLKDRIAQVYDGLRITKYLDAEQSRQLKVLETYIAKSRRGWLDRR
jgi:hypothetical protein